MSKPMLQGKLGMIQEFITTSKVIVSFIHEGLQDRALMLQNKFYVDGVPLNFDVNFSSVVQIGQLIQFNCHIYDKEREDKLDWYITKAWFYDPVNAVALPTVTSTGWISELYGRKGVLTFGNTPREEQRVFFMAKKFVHYGHRFTGKQSLNTYLTEGEPVQFEAVNCLASDENLSCHLYATLVWKGKKPQVPGDAEAGYAKPPSSIGMGEVSGILNKDCGIGFWALARNHWESFYFMRSSCFITGSKEPVKDLGYLKPGDKVYVKVIPSPEGFPTKWIAKKVMTEKSRS